MYTDYNNAAKNSLNPTMVKGTETAPKNMAEVDTEKKTCAKVLAYGTLSEHQGSIAENPKTLKPLTEPKVVGGNVVVEVVEDSYQNGVDQLKIV